MADKLMGSLPANSKWTVGKTREALDPEREKMLESLEALKTGGNDYKKAIKESNKQQVADSLAKSKVERDPSKNFEEEKAKAVANIEEGEKKAHGDENLEPEKNPLVNKEFAKKEEPTEEQTPESQTAEVMQEAKSDPESRWKMKSIMQAYFDGDIDRSTRNFMLADTVANFARNMGKDISNVGAAFTGGAIDNERGTSMWDARNQEMAKSAIESEKADIQGSREQRANDAAQLQIQAQKLQNMSLADRRVIAERIKAMAAKMPSDTAQVAVLMKAASVLTQPQMSWQELAGMQGAELLGGLLGGLGL